MGSLTALLTSVVVCYTLAASAASSIPQTRFFNLTAISAEDGKSILECWQLDTPFQISNQPGTAGVSVLNLGDAGNAQLYVLPPGFDNGVHTAPAVQYVSFVSGLAHISLPNGTDDAYVVGGKSGTILAADVASVSKIGHFTRYPSQEETVSLVVPTRNGVIPEHKVLYKGACTANELAI